VGNHHADHMVPLSAKVGTNSVGIVRLLTQATEFFFFCNYLQLLVVDFQ
jgi:hypothetical protein